ncbi:hypothetical protein SAMN04487886_13291 [Clostridium sp. DSM 8431]|uniref:hypothetical protein n=1 Tax=Clostridium sp. DSM 8431 TaxID=1761781 RepID=UPI0008EF4444|nr:hypothetical protein [Clostridium sp. DSM 8431]SFU91250.1 hypothetical protein SAMN04487886_13291 [Clostridium sp. DSM 8431]
MLLLIIINGSALFLICECGNKTNYSSKKNELLYFIYFVIIFISSYIIKNIKAEETLDKIITFVVVLFIFIFMGWMIIYNGMCFTLSKLQQYINGNNKYEIAEIYYEDKTCEKFISIEKTDNEFIGYSLEKENIKIVDNSKIESIDYKEQVNDLKGQKSEKYIENSDDESDKIVELIKSYYSNKKDGNEFYSWLKNNSTEGYYLKVGKNIEAELLDKKYNLSKEKEVK